MVRRLYRCLVWLHPAAFRLRFEEEILWIFDEAADGWGTASLLREASISLLRQWFMRSQLWKWVVAGTAAIIPPILVFGGWDPPLLAPCSYGQSWKSIVAAVAGVALLTLAFGSPIARAKLEGWVSYLGTLWRLKAVRQFRRSPASRERGISC